MTRAQYGQFAAGTGATRTFLEVVLDAGARPPDDFPRWALGDRSRGGFDGSAGCPTGADAGSTGAGMSGSADTPMVRSSIVAASACAGSGATWVGPASSNAQSSSRAWCSGSAITPTRPTPPPSTSVRGESSTPSTTMGGRCRPSHGPGSETIHELRSASPAPGSAMSAEPGGVAGAAWGTSARAPPGSSVASMDLSAADGSSGISAGSSADSAPDPKRSASRAESRTCARATSSSSIFGLGPRRPRIFGMSPSPRPPAFPRWEPGRLDTGEPQDARSPDAQSTPCLPSRVQTPDFRPVRDVTGAGRRHTARTAPR